MREKKAREVLRRLVGHEGKLLRKIGEQGEIGVEKLGQKKKKSQGRITTERTIA